MTSQFVPPPELAPVPRRGLTVEQRIQAWFELWELGEEFFLAGIRMRCKTEEEVQQAVRRWYEQQMDEHDQKLIAMLTRFDEAEKKKKHGK